MTLKDNFINQGFSVVETEPNDNSLLEFLKANYPQTIRDNEVKWDELKTALGLPVDEKVNGYGLNFIGRNVATAKYKQKTDKALKINADLSKNFDTTQNMVLKGDNLDCLKILKSRYSGAIKCIYIDPPYNTANDEFIYPDKFDKEEAEVLGLANISEADYDRMQFSFRTKKSHNGWLAFMYPRLLLARDLLSDDGVIFISIDDNEQANLKLLCDEIFGEENFVADIIWNSRKSVSNDTIVSLNHNYTLFYSKDISYLQANKADYRLNTAEDKFSNPDNDPKGIWVADPFDAPNLRPNLTYPIENPNTGEIFMPPKGRCWRTTKDEYDRFLNEGRIIFGKTGKSKPQLKRYFSEAKKNGTVPKSIWDDVGTTTNGTQELEDLFGEKVFNNPKPVSLISKIVEIASFRDSIILDFFAGSGTTGQAVMQLNAEDEGNRRFILCQIDEPIKEDKPAYKFCLDNNLPPVISSITVERLRRAGEKIEKEAEERQKEKKGQLNFENQTSHSSDTGFKVFDLTEAPKLEMADDGQIVMQNTDADPLSSIFNIIFAVGIDDPNATLECLLPDCLYKIGNNHYITNAQQLDKPENKHLLTEAIKNGKVYIDGWTASLNTTLQNFKEDVKIVF